MFDKELVLLDGTVALLTGTDIPPFSTDVNTSTGFVVLDLGETGVGGLAAVLIVPAVATGYANNLTAMIQASDEVDRNFVAVCDFPVLYTYIRKMACVATTGYLRTDIGETLTGDGAGNDTGVLLSYDSALGTDNGTGYILVAMVGSDDLFDQLNETLTTGAGTGVMVHALAATVPKQPTPDIYVQRFATDKRYVRLNLTILATGFGFVECNLTPFPLRSESV